MARSAGVGPDIWLAGDPADLKEWLKYGSAGIVTNTVVLNDMAKKYGQVTDVIRRYLDITDKKVVVEIDGHTTQELLDVGEVFTRMSKQVVLKIPCTVHGLGAFTALAQSGVETMCTTVFSLPQAAAVAQAGATHVLTFCEPFRAVSGDPTKLVRECAEMFRGWERRSLITAALVRSVETAYAALRDGADGIIVFWPVYRDMMQHHLTDEWNKTFLDNWNQMHAAGQLAGVPVAGH
jgi:transaldolase